MTMTLTQPNAKGLEDVSMIKTISWKDLREGDWLAQDVVVGNKIIKARSINTIKNYLMFLEDAYLILKIPFFSFSLRPSTAFITSPLTACDP